MSGSLLVCFPAKQNGNKQKPSSFVIDIWLYVPVGNDQRVKLLKSNCLGNYNSKEHP